MAQLSSFFQRPNDWRLHNREQVLEHYGCSFEELPEIERKELDREDAEWVAAYGKNGSVEKEIRKFYKGRGERTDHETAMSGLDKEEMPVSLEQNKPGWLGRLLDFNKSQGIKNAKADNREPERGPDKD